MFKSQYLTISERGIDLTKNNQIIRHFEYYEIDFVEFKNGHLINNWIFSFVLGILITILSFIIGFNSFINFDVQDAPIAHFQTFLSVRLVIPIITCIFGLILIYQAIKRSSILLINSNGKKFKVVLKEFEKTNELDEIIKFLSKRVRLIKKIKTTA